MALAMTLIIGTLLVGTLTTTILQAKSMRYQLDRTYAQGIVEGALELAQKSMVDLAADFTAPPTSGTVTLDGNTIQWTAKELGVLAMRTGSDGVQMICQPYEISASLDVGDATARITRVVDLTLSPIFQYALFYNMLCEISPESAMQIQGRVHVNGDLYLDTPTTLEVDTDHLEATGGIYRGRVDEPERAGIVSIREFEDTVYSELLPTADSSFAGWVQSSLRTWDGSVKSGAHGVEKVTGPELSSTAPGGYYDTNAGLKIVGLQAYNQAGAPLSLPSNVISKKQFYDSREKTTVTVTEIDLAALASSGFYPTNGLIYARDDATESRPNGIRLVNGSILPTPLTVVTENPLYIQGDYNTVAKQPAAVIADSVNLLSNGWNDSRSTNSELGLDKAALRFEEKRRLIEAEDDDEKQLKRLAKLETKIAGSSSEPSIPLALETTYNLSIMAGVVLEDGVPSGGFQNLIRLHEDWAGKTLTLLGAMVAMHESQYATSPIDPAAFVDPIRLFAFDSDLLDPTLLPPFSPNAVSMRRVYWDDDQRIVFKPADATLSMFPEEPVYDPWAYDGGYFAKIIEDPNEYRSTDSPVDFSDVIEAEEPDTADRDVKTQAEDRGVFKDRAKAAEKLAKRAEKAAKEAEKDDDLAAAQAAALLAEQQALIAERAFTDSGEHKSLKKSVEKARKAADKAQEYVDEILDPKGKGKK